MKITIKLLYQVSNQGIAVFYDVVLIKYHLQKRVMFFKDYRSIRLQNRNFKSLLNLLKYLSSKKIT